MAWFADRSDLRTSRRDPWLAGLGAGFVAILVAAVVSNPLGHATNDPDSTGCVLYFQRLVAGDRLEAFVSLTPKPFLTLLYGISWSLTNDWRVLVWGTLAIYGMAVALAIVVGNRIGGSAAAAFTGVAVLAWPNLLLEALGANSVPWALALWMVAALELTSGRPRPWLIGVVLFLAGLTRIETLWLFGAAALAAGALLVGGARDGSWRRATGPFVVVAFGIATVAVMCLHDALLTGDPLYWTRVVAGYTRLVVPDLQPMSIGQFLAQWVVPHYGIRLPLLLISAVGLWALMVRSQRLIATALAVLAAGVFLGQAFLALRGLSISERYWEEADVALVIAAGAGFAAIVDRARGSARLLSGARSRLRLGRLGAPAASAMVALAVAWPVVVSVDVEHRIATRRLVSANLAAVAPLLPGVLAGATGRVLPVEGVPLPVVEPTGARLIAPRRDIVRITVETGVPFTALGDMYLAFRTETPESILSPGMWVFHDAVDDGSGGPYAPFETTVARRIGSLDLVPVNATLPPGVYLLRVDAGTADVAPVPRERTGTQRDPGYGRMRRWMARSRSAWVDQL